MSNFEISSEDRLLASVLSTYKIPQEFKQISDHFALYDLDYFKSKLNVLELLEEGEYTLDKRI